MKYIMTKLLNLFVFGVAAFALSSCTEKVLDNYDNVESQVFSEWMAINRPNLVENLQPEGYYVDIIEEGDLTTPTCGDDTWVKYEFTAYDLYGNVVSTRDDVVAWQQGNFTLNTRYVPMFRLCGAYDTDVKEATYYAMRNPLKIGDRKVLLYLGSEVVVYMPSSIIGSSSSADGGYQGQFTLSTYHPMIAHLKIVEVMDNPVAVEGDNVDLFAEQNGGVSITYEESDEDETTPELDDVDKEAILVAKEKDPKAWTNVSDTIPQLYVNRRFTPDYSGATFVYQNPYSSEVPESPYTKSLSEIDQRIKEALLKRFSDFKVEDNLAGERVGYESSAKVWYIGRFLDGFIFDTNIDEVRQIVYDDYDDDSSVLTFEYEESTTIKAWTYTIPQLRYGQWAAIVSTSTMAYGIQGVGGSTSTSSSSTANNSYYDYYNYMNSYNYSGYGGYYGGYYNNYYGGYYGNYGYGNYGYGDSSSSAPTVTISTTTTDIPSYTPLIFEIYIEPATVEEEEEE